MQRELKSQGNGLPQPVSVLPSHKLGEGNSLSPIKFCFKASTSSLVPLKAAPPASFATGVLLAMLPSAHSHAQQTLPAPHRTSTCLGQKRGGPKQHGWATFHTR